MRMLCNIAISRQMRDLLLEKIFEVTEYLKTVIKPEESQEVFFSITLWA